MTTCSALVAQDHRTTALTEVWQFQAVVGVGVGEVLGVVAWQMGVLHRNVGSHGASNKMLQAL